MLDFPFLQLRYTAHHALPKEDLAADAKILVGDAAYHRVSEEWKGHVYLPTKLPDDGVNLFVSVSSIARLPSM